MSERRMHRRAFFTFQDNIGLTIATTNTGATVQGTLLSISQGGLGFTVKRHDVPNVKVNQPILIKELSLPEPVTRLENLKAEIRFIIDLDNYARISLGCRFRSITRHLKKNIQRLVDKKAEILTR